MDGLPSSTARAGVVRRLLLRLPAWCRAALIAAGVAQSWATPGRFTAFSDSRPFLWGLRDVARSWSYETVGSGAVEYSSTRLLEALVRQLVTSGGGSDPFAQRVWFAVCAAVCAAAVARLAQLVTARRWVATAVGVFSVVNPFQLIQLPNMLPMLTIACIALLIRAFTEMWRGNGASRWDAIQVALLASVISRNPPLLVLVAATGVCGVVVVLCHRGPQLRRVAAFCAWVAVSSAFWAVPMALHFATGHPGVDVVATTSVDTWSWAQANTSVDHVAALKGTWVWGDGEMLPVSVRLSSLPWSLLAAGIPGAVLISTVLAWRRRWVKVVAAVVVVLLVVSSGLSWPFAPLNRILYEYMPLWWLFRQPFTKFGCFLVVAYALLLAVGLDGLAARRATNIGRRWSRTASGALTVCATMAVAFSSPVWLGTALPNTRPTLPGSRVALPPEMYQLGAWLDAAPGAGAVLELPLTDYYQRGTTWGFYGGDDVLRHLTARRVFAVKPCCGYYEASGSTPSLLRIAEESIMAGDDEALRAVLASLGVEYITIRTDLDSYGFSRSYRDADRLIMAAASSQLLKPGYSSPYATVFSVADSHDKSVARGVVHVPLGLSAAETAEVVAAVRGSAVVASNAAATTEVWVADDRAATRTIELAAGGEYVLATRQRTGLMWEARATETVTGWKVALSPVTSIVLDGMSELPVTRTVRLDAEPTAVMVDGNRFSFVDGRVVFSATTTVDFELDSGPTAPASVLSPEICPDESGGLPNAATVTMQSDSASLTVSDNFGCIQAELPEPQRSGTDVSWEVSGDIEQHGGLGVRVCVWLPSTNSCAVGSPDIISDPQTELSFTATASAAEAEGAVLSLVANAIGAEKMTVTWAAVGVLGTPTMSGPHPLPPVSSRRPVTLSAGTHTLRANPAITADTITGEPSVASCRLGLAVTGASSDALTLASEGGFSLRATNDPVCATLPVIVPAGITNLNLRIEHRTLDGVPMQWCLRGPNGTCAASGYLEDSPGRWSTVDTEVSVAPQPDGSALQYGLELVVVPPTGSRYQKVSVTQVATVSLRPVYGLVTVVHPVVSLSAAVVGSNDAYAKGWRLSNAPASAQHVLVDGWANGWVVESKPDTEWRPHFRFAPDRLVAAAFAVSGMSLAAAAVFSVRRPRRRPIAAAD